MDNTEFFMELLDREREHGRMLQEEEAITTLLNAKLSEALRDDEKHDWSDNYKDLCNVKLTVGEIALLIGYTIPDWLKKAAAEVKKAKEEEKDG